MSAFLYKACVDHAQPAMPTYVTDNLVVLIIVMIVTVDSLVKHIVFVPCGQLAQVFLQNINIVRV